MNTYLVLAGAGMTALILFMAIATVVVARVRRPRQRLKKRMVALGLAQPDSSSRATGANPRQRRIQEKLQEMEQKGKSRKRDRIRTDLVQAGFDTNIRKFVLVSLGVGLATGLVCLMLGLSNIVSGLAVIAGGLILPKIFIRLVAKSRQNKFTEQFAGAVDIIVRGVRSGLPVGECMNIVSNDVPDPVGEEFRRLVEGQKVGVAIETLLQQGLERIPTQEFKFFAIVLQIQRSTGGNLAETLENLTGVLRERKKLKDKIKSLSSEAKASAWIIGCLPVFVAGGLSAMTPGYMDPFFASFWGKALFWFGALWMLTGILTMKKMINFKV